MLAWFDQEGNPSGYLAPIYHGSIISHVIRFDRMSIQCMYVEEKSAYYLQRILWRNPLEGWQFAHVLIMEPFDFEVKIHVFGAFA